LFQGKSATGQLTFGMGTGAGFPFVETSSDVLDGLFHHVAGIWNGTDLELIVDGVSIGTTPMPTPALNTRAMNIGFAWGGGTPQRFFRGAVDELSVYDRALTSTEISDIFNAGTEGKCPTPVGSGNPNTLTARLEINGVATGSTNGPFSSLIPAGGALNLDWSGPANQPVILLGGVLNPGAAGAPCVGQLDLGTPPLFADVFLLFDGTSFPGSLIFNLDSGGNAHMGFNVPVAAPPGILISLQGLVQQGGATPCFVAFTAAHSIIIQ